ncbi:hypothetical protein TYRP_013950 [Tyrophagus putrescentiae]|nr:hypothetical protein TYRP_013950 [Tyrophagus putrescentiae]
MTPGCECPAWLVKVAPGCESPAWLVMLTPGCECPAWLVKVAPVKFVQYFSEAQEFSVWLFSLTTFCHLLNGLLFDLYMLHFSHATILMLTTVLTTLVVGLVKVWQVNSLLKVNKSDVIRYSKFLLYRHHLILTLTQLMPFKIVWGKVFTAFLVANLPSNLFLTTLAIRSKFEGRQNNHSSNFSAFFGVTFALCQAVTVFNFHLAIVQLPRAIHVRTKLLISCIAKRSFCLRKEIRGRVKIAAFIWAFHVTPGRRYGVTYASSGLITLNTFFKFSLLYVKFLLISYKLSIRFLE